MFNQYKELTKAILFNALLLASLIGADLKADQRSRVFDETVRKAAEEVSSAVIQLRYIGPRTQGTNASSEILLTTGLLIDAEGWILTSDFGLPAKPETETSPIAIIVTFADGSEHTAQLVARDFPRRIALLKLRDQVESLDFNFSVSLSQVPGQTAIVLGRGYNAKQIDYSVGIVSAVDRLSGRAIQTDANTSASNYGGPLLNLQGEVLGIVSPLAPDEQGGEEWYDSGIGFAVPMAALKQRLATLRAGDNIHAGWAGVQLAAGNLFSSPPIVSKTIGPVAKAGLQSGDRITQVAGTSTPTVARFRKELSRYDAGQQLSLLVRRKEEEKTITFTLIQKPIDQEEIKSESPRETKLNKPN